MNAYQRENRNKRLIQWIFGSMFFSFPSTYKMRLWAYGKLFQMGSEPIIEDNVWIHRTHGTDGRIEMGNRVLLARGASIDYTGGVRLGNNVVLSDGAMIYSHAHDPLCPRSKIIKKTPLHVCDDAWICARAMIMPGVEYISCGAIISPGSVVYKRVPDYGVVRGNPARLVAVVSPEARKAEESQ